MKYKIKLNNSNICMLVLEILKCTLIFIFAREIIEPILYKIIDNYLYYFISITKYLEILPDIEKIIFSAICLFVILRSLINCLEIEVVEK